jgi:hypothetical protein
MKIERLPSEYYVRHQALYYTDQRCQPWHIECVVAMDAVGTTLSIVALAVNVVQYLSDVKSAGKGMQRLLVEVSTTTGLLTALKTLAEVDEDWVQTLESLAKVDQSMIDPDQRNSAKAPLDQIRELLDQLNRTLAPVKGIRKVA